MRMDTLFSCRNCIHDCAQSLVIGGGDGFCLKHRSVLTQPGRTTCKYLHRKDLPWFVVDEGLREHAAQYAGFSGLVDLVTNERVEVVHYSERHVWRTRRFDPLTQSLAHYDATVPRWPIFQAFAGSLDGRHALAHACSVRRYMDRCGTWKSSYRFVLSVIEDLSLQPVFREQDLELEGRVEDEDAVRAEAVWDVFFTRLAAVQEYGFHAGIEPLMWATDHFGPALVDLDWAALAGELEKRSSEWVALVIEHAEREGEFFPVAASGGNGTEGEDP